MKLVPRTCSRLLATSRSLDRRSPDIQPKVLASLACLRWFPVIRVVLAAWLLPGLILGVNVNATIAGGWTPAAGGGLGAIQAQESLTAKQLELVKEFEQRRIAAINRVIGSVVAIYDDDRQGGGSGVIIDPSGIALTNHHVIMGAGIQGWGGLADGKLYRWKLIGTDPGGDVSIIQMEGRNDFPFTPLGDSDQVRVGDWALAMGNPFILTEDQAPTVTLGIVSGVKRYQPGAGKNQLVYGNCIQVDSSINPGNSGGPLFNFKGRVIGINGRGSFKERGRVNVGLGYAISANQIKNFIPDLLATKLVEHATLDANFEDRNGKVVCSRRNIESPVARAGLKLGDELIAFEGRQIKSANQYTNLICTLPENWPIAMTIRKPDGTEKTIHTRAIGLPYPKPGRPRGKLPETPEEKRRYQRMLDMVELLSAKPGAIRFQAINRRYAKQIWNRLRQSWSTSQQTAQPADKSTYRLQIEADLVRSEQVIGHQTLDVNGEDFLLQQTIGTSRLKFERKDGVYRKTRNDDETEVLTLRQAKLEPAIIYAAGISSAVTGAPLADFGSPLIDGSGKADGQNAFRMRLTDSDGDSCFVWIRMYGDDGLPTAELTKISAHADGRDGGVIFEDWETTEQGLRLPQQARVISGLAESTVKEFRATRVSGERVSSGSNSDVEDSEQKPPGGAGLDPPTKAAGTSNVTTHSHPLTGQDRQ